MSDGSTQPMPQIVVRDPAVLGVSLTHSIFDLSSRRHLMPTLMDDPISVERQCVCPGGDVENSCIDIWTDAVDRLCDACRTFCTEIDENGIIRHLIDLYGTTIPTVTSAIVWAPNAKGTRAHAFLEECRGCHESLEAHLREWIPSSLCQQAWGRKGLLFVEADPEMKRCVACSRLVAARGSIDQGER